MRAFFRFLIWVAGILGVVGAVLYATLFDVWTVPSDDPQLSASIEPALRAGDVVLVTRHGVPSFGALARCPDPDAPGRFVIGRVFGSDHDVVDIVKEDITINHRHESSVTGCDAVTLKDPRSQEDVTLACRRYELVGTTMPFLAASEGWEPDVHATVDPGKYFLVSDDRHIHLDSRDFGAVEAQSCRHIVYRLWGAAGISDVARRFTVIW